MSKRARLNLLAIGFLLIGLVFQTTWAQTETVGEGSPVTPAVLDAKIAETESAAGLPEEVKHRRLSLYRQALTHLEEAAVRPVAIRERLRTAEAERAQTLARLQALTPAEDATADGQARRWVQVTRRRIAYDKAMQRRQAAEDARQRDREQTDAEVEDAATLTEVKEPQIDLESLSDATRGLITTAVITVALV
ncbi:MAG: hypothetical protein VBE63_30945, partial [Lamprobacter sp.]|uniref:hypothetical protein n=1 Tax=Lamprobacter sp. TaxID=3100796 RepID=UPI002B25790A